MDLHRVTLPTFVLEPRSMLERITDFMSHPEILLDANNKTEPLDKFIGVVKYFLSGWHIKPKGVKKPYNPVLGEISNVIGNMKTIPMAIMLLNKSPTILLKVLIILPIPKAVFTFKVKSVQGPNFLEIVRQP
ncbi:unnamed protein product [Absidia cylindrospora]